MITIIMPAYNSAGTICEALDSVARQTLFNARRPPASSGDPAIPDLEIIVVDDCSTDGTADVVDSWAGKGGGRKARVVKLQRNSGPAAARNRGIEEAHGEWIAFLDADDAWLPEKLAVQLDLARATPGLAMICATTCPFEKGTNPPPDADKQRGPDVRRLDLEDFAVHNPVATSTVLVKREAVLAAGGFDEQFRGPEDYDLWMRIAANHPVMKIEKPLSRYREQEGGLSQDDRKFLPQVLRVLDKAFSAGGVMHAAYRHMKPAALASQYNHASWMAFCRGARFTAMRHLLKSEWQVLTSRHRTGRGSMDAFLPLFLRYALGSNPARASGKSHEAQRQENTLRAGWKRFKFIAGSVLSEPTVSIRMRVDNEEGITPESGDGWLHYYQEFTGSHRGVPFIKNKEFGVALLPVPEEIDKYLQSINGKNSAAYYARKAERRGYIVREIDRNQHVDDIHEITISKPERQGRPLPDEKLQKRTHYSIMPNYHYYGVLTADNKLVADAWVASYNELDLIVGIMGHADHLNNGVMYQLVIHIVKHAAAMKKKGAPVKYVMYDTFFGATSGMLMFKQKLEFKPYRVNWMP